MTWFDFPAEVNEESDTYRL